METYDAHLKIADRLRMTGDEPEAFTTAIDNYMSYIQLSGPRLVYAQHMIGVCYLRQHNYLAALVSLKAALLVATSGFERGNIERDLGEAYAGLGHYDRADLALQASRLHLSATKHPQEYAATLGFTGRLERRKGSPTIACLYFAKADAILSNGSDRHNDLYNKLSFASALDAAAHPFEGRFTTVKTFWLSIQRDPVTFQRYGSRAHRLRALVLASGGYRLEEWIKSRRTPPS